MSVFIISQDWAIQNVVQQVGSLCGYSSIVSQTVKDAETKLAYLRPEDVALIVVDASVLGERSIDIQREALHLIQTWTREYPGLSVMFLGTPLQKYAILAARPALVPFVTLPVSPYDLMQTIQPLLPEACQLPPWNEK